MKRISEFKSIKNDLRSTLGQNMSNVTMHVSKNELSKETDCGETIVVFASVEV